MAANGAELTEAHLVYTKARSPTQMSASRREVDFRSWRVRDIGHRRRPVAEEIETHVEAI